MKKINLVCFMSNSCQGWSEISVVILPMLLEFSFVWLSFCPLDPFFMLTREIELLWQNSVHWDFHQRWLSLLLLRFYLVVVSGNTLLLLTVCVDWSFHIPIYFFLGNLSFLEICYTTNIVPRALTNFLTEKKSLFQGLYCTVVYLAPWEELNVSY